MMIPIMTGPRVSPVSPSARNVPTAVPPDEPARSMDKAIKTGKRKAAPNPQSAPRAMKTGSVFAKASPMQVSV